MLGRGLDHFLAAAASSKHRLGASHTSLFGPLMVFFPFLFSSLTSAPDPRADVQGGAQAAQGAPPRGPQVGTLAVAAPLRALGAAQHCTALQAIRRYAVAGVCSGCDPLQRVLASPLCCSGKALLDDFADEVADIVGGGDGASAIDAVFQRHRASQKFGADLEAQVGGR